MADYRLYFLDGAKHIRDVVPIEADTDEDACAEAPRRADGRAMELWRRDRLLRTWPAPDGPGERPASQA